MSAMVNISMPMGVRSFPSSISTLARTPRLVRDSTPATASEPANPRPRPKSKPMLKVTTRAASRETTTETTAATEHRLRMAARKPEMSSSSSPIRKKNRKIPTPSSTWTSPAGSTMPVTGPSRMPAAV